MNKPEALKILEAISLMMADSMEYLTPQDWLRISATMALGTIDMLDTPTEQKRKVADAYVSAFRDGINTRLAYNEFMEKLSPGSVN